MKTILVLLFVFVLTQVQGRSVDVESPKPNLSPLQEECLKELKLEDEKEAVASLNNREICPENNTDYNKFISCFWKKTGRQNPNGDVNYETIRLFVRDGFVQALGNDIQAVEFAERSSHKIVDACKIIEEDKDKVVVKVRNCVVEGINGIEAN